VTDPLLDYHNDLPVELSAPDITEYRESNSGVEYIHTMDSGKPGPHVLISAVVHGNELCGAIAADWLLKQAVKPVAGRLSVGFMNVEAYSSYDLNTLIALVGWTKTSIACGGPAFSLTPHAESPANSSERAPFSRFLRQWTYCSTFIRCNNPVYP